ncbi:uncharacterized protein [Apostichopus japonicus]|uniref:uncharacterized protein isoform X2 n=1 Tax=Stichopus japonicus TaxID=307972 RepID=UPI003AB77C7F
MARRETNILLHLAVIGVVLLGAQAQRQNACDSNPCENDGFCQDFFGLGHACFCLDGFTGSECQTSITTPPQEVSTTPTILQSVSSLVTSIFGSSSRPTDDDICGTVPASRIIGGANAPLGQYPWQGLLVSTQYTCGCSLINREWAITAAHCVEKEIEVTILGVAFGFVDVDTASLINSTVFAAVDRIYLHPGYNSFNFENDVALLHLEDPVDYSLYVRPICLETSSEEAALYETCDASGFGQVGLSNPTASLLQEVALDLHTKEECMFLNVSDNQICAGGGGQGICPGDSGGPLACQRADGRFNLVGVSSFFVDIDDNCGTSSSGFARVSQYNDFINSLINDGELTSNCEAIEHPVCAEMLPYNMTDSTSQEDLFDFLDGILDGATALGCPVDMAFLACATFFQDCSVDQQQRVRPCRETCLDTVLACNSNFTGFCDGLPIGSTPDQLLCPYGPDPICNEVFELTNEVTILTSPNYPSEYFSSLNCQWIAVAPGGYQILGKVRNFTTEGSFDVVVTGTGTDPNNRTSVFDTASGNVPPASQLFDTNEIWLAFASDGSVQAPGFQYELIAVKSEEVCSDGFYRCPVEGICIPASWVCDGVSDCRNGEDEQSCEVVCETVQSNFCRGLPYSEATLALDYVSDTKSAEAFLSFVDPVLAGCPELATLFLCGVIFPECPDGAVGYFPCQQDCQMLSEVCPQIVSIVGNCTLFPSGEPEGNVTCLSGKLF